MAAAASGSVTGTALAAGAMAAMPFGVPLSTLFLGGACFFAGSCARTGMSMYRKLSSQDDVTAKAVGREIAMLFCTIPLAAVASCITFFALHVLRVEADAAAGGLMLITGVRGPEGFQWLMDTFLNQFTKMLPGKQPSQPGP